MDHNYTFLGAQYKPCILIMSGGISRPDGASDLHYWLCHRASLLPCRLGLRQVGIDTLNIPCISHPLGNNDQFHKTIFNPRVSDLHWHEDADVSVFPNLVADTALYDY